MDTGRVLCSPDQKNVLADISSNVTEKIVNTTKVVCSSFSNYATPLDTLQSSVDNVSCSSFPSYQAPNVLCSSAEKHDNPSHIPSSMTITQLNLPAIICSTKESHFNATRNVCSTEKNSRDSLLPATSGGTATENSTDMNVRFNEFIYLQCGYFSDHVFVYVISHFFSNIL